MENFIKVVHTLPKIITEASGLSYYLPRLCESLVKNGVDIKLIILEMGGKLNYPHFVKTFKLGIGPRRLGRSPEMLRWLKVQAERGNIDILHNHSLWMMPNVYPGLIAKKYKIPYIVSPHGTLGEWPFQSGSKVKKIFWPLIQKPSLKAVTCWHATSKAEYKDIRQMGFSQPVAIIPIGIDLPELPPKKKKSQKTLLFLGRINPKKGIDMLLKAWKILQDKYPDWYLKIVGPDSKRYLNKYKNMAQSLQLKRSEFTGPYYGYDKWRAYWSSDLFVLPTHHENFGIAVAEALASSTPVIITKGAPWEGIVKENAGWWIDISLDALIKTLEEAFSLPEKKLQEMGMNGRKWIEKEFTWDMTTMKMVKLYKWIMNEEEKPDYVFTN